MLSSRHLLILVVGCGVAFTSSAQEQSQPAGGLEEITVTAERIETDLQDTPVSVVQITGEEMYELGLENIAELAKFVPNVSIGPSGNGGEPNFSIRGVSQISTGISGDRSVGFYVDGQYFPRTTGSLMRALDIANVEVLRGPQGTLFGRNNTGGAISFTTRKPTQDLSGKIRLGFGSDNRQDVSGVANVPITDDIAFRGSFARYKRDGYVEGQNDQTRGDVDDFLWRTAFRFDITDNATLDLAYTDVDSKRTGFPINREGHVNPYDLNVLACQVAGACPMNPGQFVSFAPGADWIGVPVDLNTPYTDELLITGDPFKYVGGDPEFDNTHTRFANATINWQFADHLSLRSITGGMKIDTDRFSDSDDTPWPIGTSGGGLHHESWSQELHLIGDGYFDGRVKFITGVYWFGEENRQTSFSQGYGGVGRVTPDHLTQAPGVPSTTLPLSEGEEAAYYYMPPPIPGFTCETIPFPWPHPCGYLPANSPKPDPAVFVSRRSGRRFTAEPMGVCPYIHPFAGSSGNPQPVAGSVPLMGCIHTSSLGLQAMDRSAEDSTVDSWAVFGDLTVNITEKLSMSAGLRYTEDKKTWLVEGATTSLGEVLAANDGEWHSTDWRFVTQYEWTPEVMTYLNVSKAYKAGGLTDSVPFGFGGFPGLTENVFADQCEVPIEQAGTDEDNCIRNPITGEPLNSPYIPYDPESVINHEIGLRSEWFDHRFRANVSIFSMDYDDKQQEVMILPGRNDANTEFANLYGAGQVTINASKVSIDGVEAELMLAATDSLTLGLAYAYLDAHYDELDPLIVASGSLTLDTPLPRAPKYNYTFQMQYRRPVFGGFGSAQIAYAVNGKQYSGANENSQWLVPELGLINARLNYSSADRTWTAGLSVRNLTDEFYLNGGFALSDLGAGDRSFRTGDADIIFPGAPRSISLDFTYNFGR